MRDWEAGASSSSVNTGKIEERQELSNIEEHKLTTD